MKLYLDVDGVLNAFGKSAWDEAETTTVHLKVLGINNDTWPIKTSKLIGPALLATGAEIVWLTTWGESANEKISPLVDLPQDLPVGGELNWGRPWKYEYLKEVYETTSDPFIWVDDEAIPYGLEATWDLERVLLVRTDSFTGITPEQVERIKEFINK